MLTGNVSCTQKMESFDDCVLQKVQPGMDRVAMAVVMKACRDKFSPSSLPPSAVRDLSGSLSVNRNLVTGTIFNGNADWIVERRILVIGAPNTLLALLPPEAHFEYIDVNIPPLRTAALSFRIDESRIEPKYLNDWFILEAKGVEAPGDRLAKPLRADK
jgi:hypothetical protein